MKKLRIQKLRDLESKLKQLQRVHSSTLDDQVKQEIKIRKEIQDEHTRETKKVDISKAELLWGRGKGNKTFSLQTKEAAGR